jgi:Ca-activated chloride channel homolog
MSKTPLAAPHLKALLASTLLSGLTGCAATAAPMPITSPGGAVASSASNGSGASHRSAALVAGPASTAAVAATDAPGVSARGSWIGAAGESDFVLAGTHDTAIGVWVDVPSAARHAHTPADVALVVDTSGSMAGAKMDNARTAARSFVDKLSDGDIVSIHTFDDEARERLAPTTLGPSTRAAVAQVIAALTPAGGTNLFDGLRLGEARAHLAPPSHPVRRVVVISDGMANVGPSSPEILGDLAARGAEGGVQVTALGVGLEYDERTLDALAVRSSGRLYHLGEPRELSAMLERELGLLQATAATGAVVEVVPAAGVTLVGADGVRTEREPGGAIRIPLGAMFGGQHREMLVRARVTTMDADSMDARSGERPLASVRLHFQDPADGNLERVQEVVARYRVTTDEGAVAQHRSVKTDAIVATQEAAQVTLAAATKLNDGQFAKADLDLAAAEAKLRARAAVASSEKDKTRMMASAAQISLVRASAKAAAASPASAAPTRARAMSLEANQASMSAAGY